jgi:hypothetical protein
MPFSLVNVKPRKQQQRSKKMIKKPTKDAKEFFFTLSEALSEEYVNYHRAEAIKFRIDVDYKYEEPEEDVGFSGGFTPDIGTLHIEGLPQYDGTYADTNFSGENKEKLALHLGMAIINSILENIEAQVNG